MPGETLGATQNVDVTDTNFEDTQQVPLQQVLRQRPALYSNRQFISSDFLTTEEDDTLYNF